MPQKTKIDILRQQGVLNRHPLNVSDPLFHENPFFDPNDLLQVKYEMLRQASHEGLSISKASKTFGFSRPAFYEAKFALTQEGIMGLAPKKTGPKHRHKLTDEVMRFINDRLVQDGTLAAKDLATEINTRFSTQIHPRSIERALHDKKKR